MLHWRGILKVTSNVRSFHLGHEYAPPARFIGPYARFGLALLSTAIQLSSVVFLYLSADKIRPPPPRAVSEEAQAEMERIAASYQSGTMGLKNF